MSAARLALAAVLAAVALTGCTTGAEPAEPVAAASAVPTSTPSADAALVAQRKADAAALNAERKAAGGTLPCPTAGQPVRPALLAALATGEPCAGSDGVTTGPSVADCDGAALVHLPTAAAGVSVLAVEGRDAAWREVPTEQAEAAERACEP